MSESISRGHENDLDLISRQAAIDEVVAWLKDCMTDKKNGKPLTDRLKDLPSAQPEIIHCRDCKWHNREINQCNAQICASMCGEDFCSYAERREE